jgi:hypothetical protein
MVQNGDQNDDEHCYTKENEGEEDEEDEWTLCETEEGTKDNQENLISKSPRSSYASEHTRQSNPKRSLTYDNRYRTPEEAAWALRDEVVTLELKNSTGTYNPFTMGVVLVCVSLRGLLTCPTSHRLLSFEHI